MGENQGGCAPRGRKLRLKHIREKLIAVVDFFFPPDLTTPCPWCGEEEDLCDCEHRVNCTKAGTVGHLMCGLCSCGNPMFQCGGGCQPDTAPEFKYPDEYPSFLLLEQGYGSIGLHFTSEFESTSERDHLTELLTQTLNAQWVGTKLTHNTLADMRAHLRQALLVLTDNGNLYYDSILQKWRWEIKQIKGKFTI